MVSPESVYAPCSSIGTAWRRRRATLPEWWTTSGCGWLRVGSEARVRQGAGDAVWVFTSAIGLILPVPRPAGLEIDLQTPAHRPVPRAIPATLRRWSCGPAGATCDGAPGWRPLASASRLDQLIAAKSGVRHRREGRRSGLGAMAVRRRSLSRAVCQRRGPSNQEPQLWRWMSEVPACGASRCPCGPSPMGSLLAALARAREQGQSIEADSTWGDPK